MVSKTTKSALFGAIGVLGGYYLARKLNAKHPILYILAGSLASTVLQQPGELKKLVG